MKIQKNIHVSIAAYQIQVMKIHVYAKYTFGKAQTVTTVSADPFTMNTF